VHVISYSVVVIEGDSSFTTPDNDAVVQHLKCEPIEGDSSEFTLTDTSNSNPMRVIPRVPRCYGHMDTWTLQLLLGKAGRPRGVPASDVKSG
jgi:hypothetical protein